MSANNWPSWLQYDPPNVSTVDDCPPFRLLEFNDRRKSRGAEAARVQIDADGNWLWMNANDLRANLKEFGFHPELEKALARYSK